MVSFNSHQYGLRIVQLLPAPYDKYQLAVANRVVLVTPDHAFQFLGANLGKPLQGKAKHQVIGSGRPYTLAMLPKQVTAATVFEITTQGMGKSTDDVPVNDHPPPNEIPEVPAVPPAEKAEQLESGDNSQDRI